ncbi:sensor domain-containing diguanylate cyclase [Candidatus Epulonipiscium viviparus]|uniref:sensor domain-containing diguanylate cyclase n=1 Tax=Candidatus Epulonipiscium viviparus TaxID=420336 RepID=UPI00273804FC|nr:sensor domain-containing diguanylate cyclase [Candidatus Epulopiscium viviparus]
MIIILSIIFLAIFFIHNIIFFDMLSKILPLKIAKHYTYIISLFNTIFGAFWVSLIPISLVGAYFIFILVYCTEVILFYEKFIYIKITIALTMVIQLFCVGAIVVPVMSLFFSMSMNTIINNPVLLLHSRIIISITCIIMTLLLLKYATPKYLQKMAQDTNRIKILLILEITTIVAILTTASANYSDFYSTKHILQQFIQGISWFVVNLIGIFMVIGIEILEESRVTLENQFQLNEIYKKSVVLGSTVTLHVDCTTGRILNHAYQGSINTVFIGSSYNQVISDMINNQIHPDDKEKTINISNCQYMLQAFFDNNINYSFEYRLRDSPDKPYHWFRVDVFLEKSSVSTQIIALLIINDITNAKKLLSLSEIDSLSGLYNKMTTENLINQHLKNTASGALFMIDADNFKAINDNLGHDVGDDVIKDIAQTLKDIFDPTQDIIGRVGGDEFMVFLRTTKTKSDIIKIATKASQLLKKTYSGESISVTISASIGIAVVDNTMCNFKDLYIVADAALYNSKREGKDTFTIYSEY